jgi:hypothetical protein
MNVSNCTIEKALESLIEASVELSTLRITHTFDSPARQDVLEEQSSSSTVDKAFEAAAHQQNSERIATSEAEPEKRPVAKNVTQVNASQFNTGIVVDKDSLVYQYELLKLVLETIGGGELVEYINKGGLMILAFPDGELFNNQLNKPLSAVGFVALDSGTAWLLENVPHDLFSWNRPSPHGKNFYEEIVRFLREWLELNDVVAPGTQFGYRTLMFND